MIVAAVALVLGIGTAVAIDFKTIVDTEVNHQIEGYKRFMERRKAMEAAKAAAEQQQQQAPAENAAPPPPSN